MTAVISVNTREGAIDNVNPFTAHRGSLTTFVYFATRAVLRGRFQCFISNEPGQPLVLSTTAVFTHFAQTRVDVGPPVVRFVPICT